LISKILFAIGSVIVFEGFFLAIIPDRLRKALTQISLATNSQLSRIGLVMMAVGIVLIGLSDF
jgi:uncharacterized protein YjeT (DUF2065 family)